jgi:hypothetical protein
MNSQIYSAENVHAEMIEKALALLHIIEEDQSIEDINEDPEARAVRLQMQTAARRLVAKMIEDIRASERTQPQARRFALAA